MLPGPSVAVQPHPTFEVLVGKVARICDSPVPAMHASSDTVTSTQRFLGRPDAVLLTPSESASAFPFNGMPPRRVPTSRRAAIPVADRYPSD